MNKLVSILLFTSMSRKINNLKQCVRISMPLLHSNKINYHCIFVSLKYIGNQSMNRFISFFGWVWGGVSTLEKKMMGTVADVFVHKKKNAKYQ